MSDKNMIHQILEDNYIAELFQEDGVTLLEMENLVSCPKNQESSKEQMVPLLDLCDWLNYLRDLEDVIGIVEETSGFSGSRGSGKELRVLLKLELKGALKNPRKDCDFDKVFNPIQETLLRILAEKLSFENWLNTIKTQQSPATESSEDPQQVEEGLDDLELQTDPAQAMAV